MLAPQCPVLSRIISRLQGFPWRPVPLVLAAATVLAWRQSAQERVGDHAHDLVALLADAGLHTTASETLWVDPAPNGVVEAMAQTRRLLVRATEHGELHDLYVVRVRVLPDGSLLGLDAAHNLTRTPSADEGVPLLDHQMAVYTTVIEGVTTNIYSLDLSHDPLTSSDDTTRLGRWQASLTRLQETGQLEGVGRRGWTFDPAPSSVDIRLLGTQIVVVADGRTMRLPREGLDPIEGACWLRPHRTAPARAGNFVTWAVDRVRGLSWFGDERMQALKAFAFEVKDEVERGVKGVTQDTSEKEILADLGDLATNKVPTYTDPETGWPPLPMKPYITPPLPGEGEWASIQDDPFVLANPGVPPAFVTSFIRTDRERRYTRIYVTVWDPRQVQMHMMAGTVEPIGATGEAGPGLIPRTPEVLGRLVGAMNGGFQALHGEFGMMGDGVVYLPPKPFAATVAEMRDGSTGFGSWPKEPDVPPSVFSYRQNLTAIVKDEKFNPYNRTWWGGTPPDQTDKVHTVRSGICLTREDFVAYFYGAEIAAEVLAQAMIQARCKFGIHLDMNVGHTGLEFYRVGPAEQVAPLGRPLQSDWEAEGPVPGMEGWRFRGRRMIRSMPLMNFPRYIHREGRDFFYLTLRNLLPGIDVPGVPEAEAHWRTRGLPQHGFPPAIATTSVHPIPSSPGLQVRLLKVDPRVVRVAGTPGTEANSATIASFAGIARSRKPRPTLWLGKGVFSIGVEKPEDGVELFSGLEPGEQPTGNTPAMIGIADDGGMLVYAEVVAHEAGDGTSRSEGAAAGAVAASGLAALEQILDRLACSSRIQLAHSLQIALGGTMLLDGTAANPDSAAQLRLVRGAGPGAHSIFDDTPIVPADVWHPLQMRRIRYFKKPASTTAASSSGASPDQGHTAAAAGIATVVPASPGPSEPRGTRDGHTATRRPADSPRPSQGSH